MNLVLQQKQDISFFPSAKTSPQLFCYSTKTHHKFGFFGMLKVSNTYSSIAILTEANRILVLYLFTLVY